MTHPNRPERQWRTAKPSRRIAQIDQLPDHYYAQVDQPVPEPFKRLEQADQFFANTGAVIRHGGNSAYYAPATDHIQMPPFEMFKDAESHTATLAHETIHWVGAPHRLNRDLSRYAKAKTAK